MTDQNQTPHFPCGPCPLIDEISAQINLYRVALLHVEPIFNDDDHAKALASYVAEIKLVRQFILDLESLYDLANATLTEDTIEETPK